MELRPLGCLQFKFGEIVLPVKIQANLSGTGRPFEA